MSTFVHGRSPVASAPAACGFFDEPAAADNSSDFEAGPVVPIAASAAFAHYAEADDFAPINAAAPSPGAPRNIRIPDLDHLLTPPALRPDDPSAPKHDDSPSFTFPTPKWLPKKARPPKMHLDGRKDAKKQPPATQHPPRGDDGMEKERQRSDIPGSPKGPYSTPPIPVPLP